MKTSGIIRIGTIIILSAPILFIASPASGQLYYASQKNFSLSTSDKKFEIISGGSNNFIAGGPSLKNSVTSKSNVLKTITKDSSEAKDINKSSDETDEIRFRTTSFVYPVNSKADVGISEYSSKLLIIYAKALKEYAKNNGFDTCYAFLGNMGILSHKKRFFVVNLVTMKIEQAGLVSHGRGQGATIYDKQYSDEAGSRCTSLGRYKILNEYKGTYGTSYRMAGLDSSNSNAYHRNIVLHSMSCIPDIENLAPACVTDGCPAVSGKFLSSLRKIIDSRKKPMLLWVFDSNLEEPAVEENYAEIISTGFSATAKETFSINTIHVSAQLHALLAKPAQKNKSLKWLTEKQNRYYDPWKE